MAVEIINRPTILTRVTKRVFLEGSEGSVGALSRVVEMHRQYLVQKWRDQSLTHEPLRGHHIFSGKTYANALQAMLSCFVADAVALAEEVASYPTGSHL